MQEKVMPGDETIRQFQTGRVFIRTVDSRGWYICEPSGVFHLYKDGEIRSGATDSRAFWETEEEATNFFKKWKQN